MKHYQCWFNYTDTEGNGKTGNIGVRAENDVKAEEAAIKALELEDIKLPEFTLIQEKAPINFNSPY